MLRIREEQLAAGGSDDLARFIDTLCAHIDAEASGRSDLTSDGSAAAGQARASGEAPADPGASRRLARTLVERALAYGIDEEVDVEQFVLLSVERGPGFERDAGLEWAQALLEGTELSGKEKAALLVAELARRS